MPEREDSEDKFILICEETEICKRLSSNDTKVRRKGVAALKHLLKSIDNRKVVDSADFSRLWNGIFHFIWMSDKPLVQEEDVESISQMIHVLKKHEMLFIREFFKTLSNQWNRISHYRTDKFLMMVRRFLRQILFFLKYSSWDSQKMESFSQELYSAVQILPLGLNLHLNDIFIEEVAKVSEGNIPTEALILLLKGYVECIVTMRPSMNIVSNINNSIFCGLARQLKLHIKQEAVGAAESNNENNAISNEDVSELPESRAFDPRPGNVDVYLPFIAFDETKIVEFLETYEMKAALPVKVKNILAQMINMFKSITNLRESLINPKKVMSESYTNPNKRKKKHNKFGLMVKKACKRLEKFESESTDIFDQKLMKKLERMNDLIQVPVGKKLVTVEKNDIASKSKKKLIKQADRVKTQTWTVTENVPESKNQAIAQRSTEWTVTESKIETNDSSIQANDSQDLELVLTGPVMEEPSSCTSPKSKRESVECTPVKDKPQSVDCTPPQDKRESVNCIPSKDQLQSIDCTPSKENRESVNGTSLKDKSQSVDCTSPKGESQSIDSTPPKEKRESVNGAPLKDKSLIVDCTPLKEKRESVNGTSLKNKSQSVDCTPPKGESQSIDSTPPKEKRESVNGAPLKDKSLIVDCTPSKEKRESVNDAPLNDKSLTVDCTPPKDKSQSLDGTPPKENRESINGASLKDKSLIVNCTPPKEKRESANGVPLKDKSLTVDCTPPKDKSQSLDNTPPKEKRESTVSTPPKIEREIVDCTPPKIKRRFIEKFSDCSPLPTDKAPSPRKSPEVITNEKSTESRISLRRSTRSRVSFRLDDDVTVCSPSKKSRKRVSEVLPAVVLPILETNTPSKLHTIDEFDARVNVDESTNPKTSPKKPADHDGGSTQKSGSKRQILTSDAPAWISVPKEELASFIPKDEKRFTINDYDDDDSDDDVDYDISGLFTSPPQKGGLKRRRSVRPATHEVKRSARLAEKAAAAKVG